MKWKGSLIGLSVGLCLGVLAVVIMLSGDKGDIFSEHRVGIGMFTVYEQRVETTTDAQGQKMQRSVVHTGPGMATLPVAGGLAGLALGAVVGYILQGKKPQRTI